MAASDRHGDLPHGSLEGRSPNPSTILSPALLSLGLGPPHLSHWPHGLSSCLFADSLIRPGLCGVMAVTSPGHRGTLRDHLLREQRKNGRVILNFTADLLGRGGRGWEEGRSEASSSSAPPSGPLVLSGWAPVREPADQQRPGCWEQ